MLALIYYFRIESIFVLSAVPVIWSGWLFPRKYIAYSALFLFTFESVGLFLVGMAHFTAPQTMVPGIIALSIFMAIGYILNITRSMSVRIQMLNDQLSEKNIELHSLSIRDPLTNLYNRRYVWEYITQQASNFTQQISLPEAQTRSLSVYDKTLLIILVDLDFFKHINDQYGHDAGDQILIQVGKRISSAVRFDDIVVRWGGEEFLVLCPLVRKEHFVQVVQKVYQSINDKPMVIRNDMQIQVTASMGVVTFPPLENSPQSISFEQCVNLADKALYVSKETGRNQIRQVQITGNPDDISAHQSILNSESAEIGSQYLKYIKL
jgi:diguanylate cyclase (GGDEF)-like protein